MNPQERFAVTCAWNAACVAVSLYYLSGSIVKAGLIAVFVYFSSLLGYGLRWLMPGGFAVTILACAVVLGFPHPEQWPGLLKSAVEAFNSVRWSLFSGSH
jgi:hypothetical protein